MFKPSFSLDGHSTTHVYSFPNINYASYTRFFFCLRNYDSKTPKHYSFRWHLPCSCFEQCRGPSALRRRSDAAWWIELVVIVTEISSLILQHISGKKLNALQISSPVRTNHIRKSSNLFRNVCRNAFRNSGMYVAIDAQCLFEHVLTKSLCLCIVLRLRLKNSSSYQQCLVVVFHLGLVEWFRACRREVQCRWLQPCVWAILYYFCRAYRGMFGLCLSFAVQ